MSKTTSKLYKNIKKILQTFTKCVQSHPEVQSTIADTGTKPHAKKKYPRECMICGNNRFTRKQRKCQNQIKETRIMEISFNCTYISFNFS